jgi:VanZ family protein
MAPNRWLQAARVVLLVILYAASDEFHQSFVPSREASVLDVLIDTAGSVLALLFLWVIGRWRRS